MTGRVSILISPGARDRPANYLAEKELQNFMDPNRRCKSFSVVEREQPSEATRINPSIRGRAGQIFITTDK